MVLRANSFRSVRYCLAISGRTVGSCFHAAKRSAKAIAETLGSCGAAYSAEPGCRAVGLDINANHLRSASSGWVTGIARPVHIGRSTQVWQIELTDESGALTCVSRLTMAIPTPRTGS
jgi:acyl-coenzyme A thioesterase PaaI-like protein